MGISPDHPAIRTAIAKGLIPADPAPPPEAKPALVAAGFAAPATWVVPFATLSETNERGWRAKSGRTIAARRAVSRTFGPHLAALAPFAEHYHRGGELRVLFVRLGGRKLDRSNLSSAIKAVEDALCIMLGSDDGAPNWVPRWEQLPGGPSGVRVSLECAA